MAAYSSTQSGDFDDVNTWGGGGFPSSTADTWTGNNGHVIKLKGSEVSGQWTINAGCILEFDGQSDTVPAILTVLQNTSNLNNGRIRQTGTGSTGYASITNNNPATQWVFILNTAPEWGGGYWKIGRVYIGGLGVETPGLGGTIELIQSFFWTEGKFIIQYSDSFIASDAEITLEAISNLERSRVWLLGDFQEGTSHVFFEDDGGAPFNTKLYVAKGNRFYDVTVNAGHTVDATQRVLVEGSLTGSITLSGVSDELISMNDLNVIGTLNARNAEIALVVKEKKEVTRRIRNE